MLKRLELVGFKSFGNKTTLDFPKGITVIVGPNGSGKSNIIDALRWLLGEREAKNLRGAKSENLIFSGTKKKTRLGMAQASVYFDNQHKALPLDFNEVVVTRKIFRDGNSEFLVNKSAVRLKEVIDLFARSKLGAKGLCIINQGNSDLFIKASPAERREMMEEILGLRQYQLKKHEAGLKLKNTQANLDKAQTTIEELTPRLRLLRRQTGKWDKRAVFAEELQLLENNYFGQKLAALNQESATLEPELKKIDGEVMTKIKELKSYEADLDKIERQKPIISGGENSHRKPQLEREVARLEIELEMMSKRAGAFKVDAEKAVNLLQEIRRELNSDKPDVKQFIKRIDDILSPDSKDDHSPNKSELLNRLKKIEQELAQIVETESSNLRGLEDFNKNFRSGLQVVNAKKDEIRQLEDKKNHLLLQKDRWFYRWQDLEEKIKDSGRQTADFQSVNTDGSFDSEEAERRILRLRNELALIGEIDEELVKEAKEVEERHNFLTVQTGDLTGASADLRHLIADLEDKIKNDFTSYLKSVNGEFGKYFKAMFGEGAAKLVSNTDESAGVAIELNMPSKGINSVESLSGGEKSLVAIAVLFSLVSVSPPPFLVCDEIDAALDEKNSRRFAGLLKEFAQKTQFAIVTHNRSVMEVADVLYGITMDDSGTSKVLSLTLSD